MPRTLFGGRDHRHDADLQHAFAAAAWIGAALAAAATVAAAISLIGALLARPAGAQTPAASPPAAGISGRVTDASNGQPVEGATVAIVGTTRGAITNADDRYAVRGIGAGPATVRVVRIGYAE